MGVHWDLVCALRKYVLIVIWCVPLIVSTLTHLVDTLSHMVGVLRKWYHWDLVGPV